MTYEKVDSFKKNHNFKHVINVSGTMTSLGSSIIVPEATEAMTSIAQKFINMDQLHCEAGKIIAELCDSEDGFVTGCAAAGIALSIAGILTKGDAYLTEELPDTETLQRKEVLIQSGHVVNYGSPILQLIKITGAVPKVVGTSTQCLPYSLDGAITDKSALGLYVVSHHTVSYGQLSLEEFSKICHKKGIPVVVDAASEYDLKGFLKAGADLVIYSGHKFLGGPTSGFIAGSHELIKAIKVQNNGIGRSMKIGKESIYGLMMTLKAWQKRDHNAVRDKEETYIHFWKEQLDNLPGVKALIAPDPTNNPLDRLQVYLKPEECGISVVQMAKKLKEYDPSIFIRAHEAELGYFFLDPCNLHGMEEAKIVIEAIVKNLKK
ncbi:MAG: aminotransferase class V-fold PLP-dependent enzyme [bacterium]|nr:aminotransferase class V-fold PLP-dependent enzyme [bacterium]